jgi:hypothetical protein
MKRLLLSILPLSAACLAHGPSAAGGHDEAGAATVPRTTARGTMVYGEDMPLGAPIDIGTALADASAWQQRAGKFEGRVAQVCQNKGCWLVLADGDRSARVFSGHRFFLPKDTAGNAIVHGVLEEHRVEEAMARHLAEDAGQDPSTIHGDQLEYRIDARSVELLPAS